MNVNEAFPSKYLKAADLQGRKVRAIIDRVEMDKIGEDTRIVMSFRGKEKSLVVNRTNANTISDMYGNETDNWFGKEIVLFPTRVDYQGKRVDAIRVEFNQPPPRQTAPAPPRADPTSPMGVAIAAERQMRPQHDERNPPPRDEMDDEIPF